jgi:hypothetical protein
MWPEIEGLRMLNAKQFMLRLAEAWPDRGFVPLRKEIVAEDWGEYSECANGFEGKRWQDIPYEHARYHRSCIWFFSTSALWYYIPAFMCGSIIDESEHGDEGWDMTTYVLKGIDLLVARESEGTNHATELGLMREFCLQLQGLCLSDDSRHEVANSLGKIDLLISAGLVARGEPDIGERETGT